MSKYLTTIGLEFHAELKTKTKIFCSCPTESGGAPNTHVCPICIGLPGVLPVLNKHVVELATKAGMALNCEINRFSKFDRKNYFYPDLPKNYQISQYPLPICRNGFIEIKDADGRPKKVRINRIHMEEDAGKLVHAGATITDSAYSLPDYNRGGVPLIEIVSEPDMASAEEARNFGEMLRLILLYCGVSDVKMEQGSLRCDVNISLRAREEDPLGVKVELKNLNSFRAVYNAIKYEEKRQAEMLDSGERIIQETRLWDEGCGETRSMRSKENDHDYRYFPEPDLVPVVLDDAWMERIAAELPELPESRRARLLSLGIGEKESAQFVANPPLALFFDRLYAEVGDAKLVSNWLLGDVTRLLNSSSAEYDVIPLDAADVAHLLELLKKGAINQASAKQVLEEMFTTGGLADEIIKERGFAQISDSSALESIVRDILDNNPQPVADYHAGKKAAFGFLMGQAMKLTKGQGNPAVVKQILTKMLDA